MSDAGGTRMVFTVDATEDELIAELKRRGWKYEESSRPSRAEKFSETKTYRILQLEKKVDK
jgi:hypothetical protein